MEANREDLLKRREWLYADRDEILKNIEAYKEECSDLDIEIININQRLKRIEEGEMRPRVTTIIAPYQDFSAIPIDVLQAAAERGTLIHHSCASYALNFQPPHEGYLDGYFQSFKAWFDNYVVEVLAVEEEVIHPALGYVGHVDLIATVAGIRPKQTVCVVDYKSPVTASRSWNMQIAAYLEASRDRYGAEVAGALMLKKDGSLPKMIWLEDGNQAFNAFTGALSAFNYIRGTK